MTDLRDELKAVADGLSSAWGEAVVRRAFAGSLPLPTDPRALVLVARRCCATLSDRTLELPPPRFGTEPCRVAMAAAVQGPMDLLDRNLAALSDGEAAEQYALSQRGQLKKRLADEAAKAARYCQAFAELTGNDRLGSRLRKSLR